MRRRHSALAGEEASAIRFAWWAAFFATLALIAVLGLAKSAQALTIPGAGGPGIVSAPPPDEELEDEAEASEDEGFAGDECEGAEDEGECDDGSSEAPQECLLTASEATVSATANNGKVRLQIRYRTSAPTKVSVTYGLHGSRGSLYLGGEKENFARQGVLRLTKTLTDDQMEKVMAARGFTIRLRVPDAPGYCQAFFDSQLDVRRATPSGLSWQASE
jgi:hypothetical protein